MKSNFLVVLITVFFLLGNPKELLSQTGVGQMLYFGSDARAFAMGRAFTAVGDNAASLYYNPASMTRVKWIDFTMTHTKLLSDVNYNYIAVVYPERHFLKSFPITAGFAVVSLSGDFDLYDENYDAVSASISETALKMAFAKKFYPDLGNFFYSFSIAVEAMMYSQKILDYSADAFGVNFSFLSNLSDPLRFGINIQNVMKPELVLAEQADVFPLVIRTGLSYEYSDLLTLAVDLQQIEDKDLEYFVGTEFKLFDLMKIRGGFNHADFTAGFGFSYSIFNVDYAYRYPQDEILSKDFKEHLFTLSLRFLSPRKLTELDLEKYYDDLKSLEKSRLNLENDMNQNFHILNRFQKTGNSSKDILKRPEGRE